MAASYIDHITITAPDLQSGAALVNQALGVMPQKGGQHPRMGTHNLLLKLGPALFLEVIAPDPAAAPPARPRWFALDTLAADAAPSLATWVARTSDIHAAASAATETPGRIEPMTRGALNWLITIPADGSLPLDGMAPALIEWQAEPHPAAGLPDAGLSLHKLELFHPEPDRIISLLKSISLQDPVSVTATPRGVAPYMVAHINTPNGIRSIGAPSASGQHSQPQLPI